MSRPQLEIADILRRHGAAWRAAQAGHVEACEGCRHTRVANNSCRHRHCPKCRGAAAREWLTARAVDLLPVGYFHVVFTVSAEIADIAFTNKAAVYDLLFRAASKTMLTIAADPRHLGARIGITAVLHTWGSALTHHQHVHMIVPGGGISLDGTRWVSSRPAFLLPIHVLSEMFRRLFLAGLSALHAAGRFRLFGDRAGLGDPQALERHLAPMKAKRWVVYSTPPFGGPEAVLAYLSRYTHRVAIANRRLIGMDEAGVTFRYKDWRRDGDARHRTMTLPADELIRRFLVHVLTVGFPASATTACSPRAGARPTSPAPASCSPSPHRPWPPSQPLRRNAAPHAPAAAGACW